MLSRLFESGAECRKVRPLLWDFARNALSETQRARVENHLSRCMRCKTEAGEVAKAEAALTGYAAAPLPSAFARPARWAEVEARIRQSDKKTPQQTPRRRPLVPLALGGTAALAVGAFGLMNLSAPVELTVPVPVVAAGQAASDARRGYTKATKSDLLFAVEPAFVGMVPTGTFPVAVVCANNGAPVEGELVLEPQRGDGTTRQIRRRVVVPSGRSRFLMYPALINISGDNGQGNFYRFDVRFVGSRAAACAPLLLRGKGTYQQVAYVGEGMGVLEPSQAVARLASPKHQERRINNYSTVYCRPENAPGIAAGYDSVRCVVLGKGAQKLTQTQWKALRDWVTEGGSVIVAGGTNPALLKTPGALALLPAAFPAKPQASEARLPNRAIGLGRVVYLDADWLSNTARRSPDFGKQWEMLLSGQAQPTLSASFARSVTDESPQTRHMPERVGQKDPFHLALPPLRTVSLLFLGYFVLAVPVSFVVLKHTRRMNLAWVTGPLLAFGFAGATYGLNRSLYMSEQSERTKGVLITQEGEQTGRFLGTTEFFFRNPGSYTVRFPHAETLMDDTDAGYTDWGGEKPRALVSRDFVTRSDETGVFAPSLQVASLAFRRLHHVQSVSLGRGVRANLRYSLQNGVPTVEGTIENGTGRVLSDVWLTNPAYNKIEIQHQNGKKREVTLVVGFPVGSIAPGTQRVKAVGRFRSYQDRGVTQMTNNLAYLLGRGPIFGTVKRAAKSPMLVARIGGAEFGARLGRDVGSEQGVAVIIGLEQAQGGAK